MRQFSFFLLVTIIIFSTSCDNTQSSDQSTSTTSSENTAQDSTQVSERTGKAVNLKSTFIHDFAPTTITQSAEKSSEADIWTIVSGVKVGTIRKNSSFKEVMRDYGVENVKKAGMVILGQNPSGGVIKGYKTFLFFEQSNELQIIFSDTINLKNPIQIIASGTAEGKWVTNNNVKIGSSLDYAIAVNRKDFYFLGYDEETYEGKFNGMVANWNKGAMESTTSLSFEPSLMSKTLPVFESFQILNKFPTNHPDVKSLGLTVSQMSFTFQ